jgi:HK97 family phage prohead protease
MEKRFLATEVRASRGPNGQRRITGYAARYNVLSHPLPCGDGTTFRERIAPGAFKRILASSPDVICCFNHDSNKVLGRTTAGTLTLSEDDRGLKFTCDLPNTEAGRDCYESVQRGDTNRFSPLHDRYVPTRKSLSSDKRVSAQPEVMSRATRGVCPRGRDEVRESPSAHESPPVLRPVGKPTCSLQTPLG